MFGGIFTGLSGMQAFSNGLRQVSNNITNLNTTGFKGSSAAFNNLYNSGASGLRFDGNTGLNGGGVVICCPSNCRMCCPDAYQGPAGAFHAA